MPEVVRRELPVFPAGAGKGAHFTPLPQDVQGGKTRAHAMQTVRVDKQVLYALWRDVRNASKFQEYVVSVEPKSATRSTWTFGDPEDPKGKRLTYDTETFEDVPGEKISWRSVDTEFAENGTVTFEDAPSGRGTLITLTENMESPGGRLGIAVAGLVRRTPRQIVVEDLRHFKELAESGEIPTVVDNSHGPRGFIGSLKARLYGENNPTPPGTSLGQSARAASDTN